MALTALVRGATATCVAARGVLVLGIVGAALFYGDSVITPAISVLSAVEGVEVVAPAPVGLVVPIAAGHPRRALFAVQRCGTAAVGRLFGPVMMVWFVALGVAGAADRRAPGHRSRAVAHLRRRVRRRPPASAFIAMGAVVLAITGAEALYADMGHFGRRPIRRAWFALVFPALHPQLPRSGRAHPRDTGRDREPVLPPRPGLGADPDGRCWPPPPPSSPRRPSSPARSRSRGRPCSWASCRA